MKNKYFGTDGIRGRANTYPMTAEMAMKVAMATGCVLRLRHPGQPTGRVVVGKDTFQTNANQTNRNLLLSPFSNMNSNPQLEIHAEDVKCSHGSTTGQIDPEALFYLRSRGISKQRAIELVVEGFAKEIFTNIKDDIFQSKINQKIGQWLESVSNHDKS